MTETLVARLNAALSGRYEIEREIGVGGMATVYLARDVRHDRNVALKVLRPELAVLMGSQRFLTEIRTTANLQHPHILPLFDSGDADGFLFFVMPFVEGETLQGRIEREKQLPVDEAVAIAIAIASALDYAHRHDVIHRDIKPANILLHDGQPMVADFGIALAVQQAGGGRLTETGLSLGTPYYMSPEQATADRDPNAASDVYSVGCVLYEMLTGEPPFTGRTAQAVLGRILTGEVVPPSEHRKSVPPHLEAVILKSLERLPADRFRTAAELVDALKDPSRMGPPGSRAASGAKPRAQILPWALFAATAVALVFTVLNPRIQDSATSSPGLTAVLDLPSNMSIRATPLAISDDGTRIVLEGFEDGVGRLLTRVLADADLKFVGIPGTDDAAQPFLSPDGTQIVFRGGGVMRRVSVEGGASSAEDPESDWAAGHWTDDGTLYYSRSYTSGLWKKTRDGEPEELTRPDPDRGELAHWYPQLLPDGEHVLFTVFRTPIDSASIDVLSLQSGVRTEVLRGGVSGHYISTGHLVYARESTLFGIPFDLDAMQTVGQAVPVIEDVAIDDSDGSAAFDVSRTGVAVYVRASEYNAPGDLVWIDRSGAQENILQESGVYWEPSLSPDERSLAFTNQSGGPPDVYVRDLIRGVSTQLTFGGGSNFSPLWTHDGERIVFASEQPVFDLFVLPVDRSAGAARPLLQTPFDKVPFSINPDGSVLYQASNPNGNNVIEYITLDASGTVESVHLSSAGDVNHAVASPDGSYLAFASNESGRYEVYTVSWPELTGRHRVSVEGGVEPRWTKDGRELVFRSGTSILAVPFDVSSGVPGTPEELFSAPMLVWARPVSLMTSPRTESGSSWSRAPLNVLRGASS